MSAIGEQTLLVSGLLLAGGGFRVFRQGSILCQAETSPQYLLADFGLTDYRGHIAHHHALAGQVSLAEKHAFQ
jgi:hypothetical protein